MQDPDAKRFHIYLVRLLSQPLALGIFNDCLPRFWRYTQATLCFSHLGWLLLVYVVKDSVTFLESLIVSTCDIESLQSADDAS